MSWNKWWRPRNRAQAFGPWSRRAFLGGGAALITLPVLESLKAPAWAQSQGPAPQRLIFYFTPNGMVMPNWTPTQVGTNYDLPPILAGLAPVQQFVNVISNLNNQPASVPAAGDHARGTAAFLTCETVERTAGDDIYNGVSIDQIAAQAMGDQTLFPSFQIGISGGVSVGDCDSGYSCAYSRNISWSSPATPVPKMTDPRQVFDRLFGGFDANLNDVQRAQRRLWRTSVLDQVTQEATDLQAKLSSSDRAKLDQYLTSVRELEIRIEGDQERSCAAPDEPAAQMSYAEQVGIMNTLMVKALECDLTRVVTFMMEQGRSLRSFDFLGVTGAHHELSHHKNIAATLELLTTINAWEVAQFADLVAQLAAVEEADGSRLIDNTLAYLSSEITDGDRHNHDNAPVLLAGGGGGTIPMGRHIALSQQTPKANLFLTMIETLGVVDPGFGDNTGALDLS